MQPHCQEVLAGTQQLDAGPTCIFGRIEKRVPMVIIQRCNAAENFHKHLFNTNVTSCLSCWSFEY